MQKLLVYVITLILGGAVLAQESEEKPKYDKDKVLDARGMVPFKVLYNPAFVSTKDANFMNPDDYVLGISLDGESKAYPLKMICWHHIVNDTIGKNKSPIAAVY